MAVTLLSGRCVSLRSRRIPCHLVKEPRCPAGSFPSPSPPDCSVRPLQRSSPSPPGRLTRRSYQQTLGRLKRELGADQPLASLTADQLRIFSE